MIGPLLLLALPSEARAQLLDELLPPAVPGFALSGNGLNNTLPNKTPMNEIRLNTRRELAQGETGWKLGGLDAAPGLTLQSGYDSAPNAAGGSALLGITPDLLLLDRAAGIGIFAQVNETAYPSATAQTIFSATVAGGWKIELPRETLTLSAAFLRSAETSFTPGAYVTSKPLDFTLKTLRVSDEIQSARFTVTPFAGASFYSFQEVPEENRTDLHLGATFHYDNGAPLSYVASVRGTNSNSHDSNQDANSFTLLTGLQDKASGIWSVSLLSGGAWRVPRQGRGLSEPVLEARLDWAPSRLDELHLTLIREIDDPDRLSAAPYTLSKADLNFLQSGPGRISASANAEISYESYMRSALRETYYSAGATLKWQMNPALSLAWHYLFNDRQANRLRAANEHVVSLTLGWTP